MRVLFVCEWYSEGMGYLENRLPAELKSAGSEVHVVTSQAQVYFNTPNYEEIYGSYLGDRILPPGMYESDGSTVERLPLIEVRGRIGMRGLGAAVDRFAPDVVQVLDHSSLAAMQVGWARSRRRFRLFTANHLMGSVFPPPDQRPPAFTWRIKTLLSLWIPGRLLSLLTEKCFAISPDAADVAHRYLGVPRQKIAEGALGVDTRLFRPPALSDTEQRAAMRREFGASDTDVVCIYTGKLTKDKDPLCLARAIEYLRQEGLPVRGVFIGEGPLSAEIAASEGCSLVPFQRFRDLPDFYRAADIGVWPRQESTSVFDAKACGLPVVGSDRVEDGRYARGGATYEEGEPRELASVLRGFFDKQIRTAAGEAARRDVVEHRSWARVAELRLRDYERALKAHV